MIKNIADKIKIIHEKYYDYLANFLYPEKDAISMEEWLDVQAKNNPKFFAWLFDDHSRKFPEKLSFADIKDNDRLFEEYKYFKTCLKGTF